MVASDSRLTVTLAGQFDGEATYVWVPLRGRCEEGPADGIDQEYLDVNDISDGDDGAKWQVSVRTADGTVRQTATYQKVGP